MKKTLLVLFTMLIASCAQIEPSRLPPMELPDQWRAGPDADTNGTPWWKAFGDPTLDRLESLALADNLDIMQAQARLEQARDAAGIAEAALGPTIFLDSSVGKAEQSLNSGLGTLSKLIPNYERTLEPGKVGFSGAWDLDFAGGLKSQKEAAAASVLVDAEALEALRLGITAEVADSYVVLLTAHQQKNALLRQLDLLASQKKIMKVRVQVGASSREAFNSFNGMLEQLTASLPLLNATIAIQKNKLAVLLGRHPSNWDLEMAGDQSIPISADPAGGIPVKLLRRRPDLLAAEHRVTVAGANLSASIAEYYPRISLSAALGQDANNYANLNASKSTFLQSFIGLRWRLFDFGRIDAEVKVARGKQKEALLAYRAAVLSAASDVEMGFSQLGAARDRLHHLEEERNEVRRVLQSVSSALSTGASSQDEVFGAQKNVARSDFDVLSAQRDVARAIIVAARALGGPIGNL